MPSPLPGKREVEVVGVRGAPVVSCSGEWGPRTACWGQSLPGLVWGSLVDRAVAFLEQVQVNLQG